MDFINQKVDALQSINQLLGGPHDVIKAVEQLQDDNQSLRQQIAKFEEADAVSQKKELLHKVQV
jgi:cell division septum initiation protein DivIVA